jgi:hypothetical protein
MSPSCRLLRYEPWALRLRFVGLCYQLGAQTAFSMTGDADEFAPPEVSTGIQYKKE